MLSEEVVRSTESNSSKVVHPVQLLAFICVDGIRFGTISSQYCLKIIGLCLSFVIENSSMSLNDAL